MLTRPTPTRHTSMLILAKLKVASGDSEPLREVAWNYLQLFKREAEWQRGSDIQKQRGLCPSHHIIQATVPYIIINNTLAPYLAITEKK